MAFITWKYFLFFAVVMLLYWLLPQRARWIALLGASMFFAYLLGLSCLLWLCAAIVISYAAGLRIHKARQAGQDGAAKAYLVVALAACFGALFVFKYLGFTVSSVAAALRVTPPAFSLATPLGMSFYIFSVTGYLIDIYRGKTAAVSHPGKYALAVSFFPKLMQGPIEPLAAFSASLDVKRVFDYAAVRKGALLVLFGIFKKAVIADRLCVAVNTVFDALPQGGLSSLSVAAGVFFYAFQLYADFSGYVDIAAGCSQMLGLSLCPNFRQPYLARSVTDFWRRWHITLSVWLRDYVYISLGGNRVSRPRWCFNILVTFIISGLWHGTGCTFLVWGLLHGLYQVVEKLTAPPRQRLRDKLPPSLQRLSGPVSVLVTFALVSLAWLFFRAPSLADALTALRLLVSSTAQPSIAELGITKREFLLSLVCIASLIVYDLISERRDVAARVEDWPLPLRWAVYLAFLFAVILFGFYGSLSAASFIYIGF